MKTHSPCHKAVAWRHDARFGFTLVEVMMAVGVGALVITGAMTFMYWSGICASGITVQNQINFQGGNSIEFIQSRVRLATSITNDSTGNILTLGFDDNPSVDSDANGRAFDDKNHFEQFKFVGINSTNYQDVSTNSLIYIPGGGASSKVLLPAGVRNLPGTPIFGLTNRFTAIIRYGIVDTYPRDRFQSIDIKGTAVPLNRPTTTNIVAILP